MRAAILRWLPGEIAKHAGVQRLGVFGSYARGDWGVGSDLDLVVVVDRSDEPFERRALAWNLSPLPVPVQLLIYTRAEWQRLRAASGRFIRMLESETEWMVELAP